MSDSIMRVKVHVPYRLLTSENQVGKCGALVQYPPCPTPPREASSWHMRLGQLVVTPSFWADTSLLSTALLPLSFLVSAGARLRESVAAAPFVAPCAHPKLQPCTAAAGSRAHAVSSLDCCLSCGRVPVVCVGGAVAGGSGKTPVALSLAARLRSEVRVHFLTRGYGGTAQRPLQVRPDEHDAELVGDEAMMLAAEAPTWVAAARSAAAAAACASTSPPQLLAGAGPSFSVASQPRSLTPRPQDPRPRLKLARVCAAAGC